MPKGELVVNGRFEWFAEKSDGNKRKHGYSFDEVLPIFDDNYFFEIYDVAHSDDEQTRYCGYGALRDKCVVLQIVYTDGEKTHIISARDATAKERELYYARIRELYR